METIRLGAATMPDRSRLVAWLGLLALAQTCDVLTTWADMDRGGVEANRLTAMLLGVGGLGLLWLVKFSLVAAMTLAVILTRRQLLHGGSGGSLAQAAVWRGLQISVLMLVAISIHNVAVLSALVDVWG